MLYAVQGVGRMKGILLSIGKVIQGMAPTLPLGAEMIALCDWRSSGTFGLMAAASGVVRLCTTTGHCKEYPNMTCWEIWHAVRGVLPSLSCRKRDAEETATVDEGEMDAEMADQS